MRSFSALCLLSLTISIALFCNNNQYNELATFVLNSDLEGLEKALPDCSLTTGEKTSLRSLAEDMSLKRLKEWEKSRYFGVNVPYPPSEDKKVILIFVLGCLSPLVIFADLFVPDALKNTGMTESTKFRVWSITTAVSGAIFCASIVAIKKISSSVVKEWKKRYNEALKLVEDLYTNSIKIRALLYGLA